jgi:hypothetical protein
MIERSRSMRLLPDCCPQSWLKTSDPACPIGSRDGVPSGSRASARSTLSATAARACDRVCSGASYKLAAIASMSPFSIEVTAQPPLSSS